VISRKGGVGKTTTTLMLGHTFAAHRGDRVVALDGNPDAGSLAYRVRRETTNSIMDLLTAPNEVRRYADIRAYTNQAPTRLEIVAASDDPRITDALGEEDYRRVAELLEVHYNLTCMDTGTGVLESATRGILDLADQVVVVMAPSLDSARTAASTLDWLEQNGHEDLVMGSVAVINSMGRNGQGEPSRFEETLLKRSGLVEVDRIEDHFRARCKDVIRIPWDPLLDAGAEAEPDDLKPETREAYLELAAAVADGFIERPKRELAHRVRGAR
jgi:putative peptide zinc metalloprotease protein